MLRSVRLDYIVFVWFFVSLCVNTVRKELRKNVEMFNGSY